MIIGKRILGKAIATWLGPTGEAARRAVSQVRQRVTSASRTRLDFYFDIADAVELPRGPGGEPARRGVPGRARGPRRHAARVRRRSDAGAARRLTRSATRSSSPTTATSTSPARRNADAGAVRDVGTVLIRDRPARDQLRCALELGAAMWANDKQGDREAARHVGHRGARLGPADPQHELRRAAQGRPLPWARCSSYAGEWYWGIDRLPYLEAALARDSRLRCRARRDAAAQADRGAGRAVGEAADLRDVVLVPLAVLVPRARADRGRARAVRRAARAPADRADGRRAACRCRRSSACTSCATRSARPIGSASRSASCAIRSGAGVENCIAIAHWADSARQARSRSRSRRCAASGPRRATSPSTSTCAT